MHFPSLKKHFSALVYREKKSISKPVRKLNYDVGYTHILHLFSRLLQRKINRTMYCIRRVTQKQTNQETEVVILIKAIQKPTKQISDVITIRVLLIISVEF